MKKILSLMLAVIMSVSCFYLLPYAVAASEISGESTEALVGEQIKIPISITDNAGIMGFRLIVEYDKDYLRPISVDRGTVTATGNFNDSIETSKTNRFDIFWNASENVNGDGIIAYLIFEALKAADDTKIKLSYSQDDTFNEQWNDVILDCRDISVSIENIDSVSAKGYICGKAISGEKAIGVIEIGNLKNSSYKLSVTIPDTVLSIEGFFCKNADISVQKNGNTYEITISGINDTVDALSITTEMTVSDIFSGNENYEITCEDILCGYFNVSAEEAGICAFVYGSKTNGEINDIIDVPIYLKNSSNIMGYKLIFSYDRDVIEPISATNTLSLGGNFDDSIGTSDNEFSVLWNNSSPILNDGQIISLKVKILKKEYSEIAIAYSKEDTFDELWSEVSMACGPVIINADFSSPEEPHEHDMGEWTQVKAATCTSDGLKERSCIYCDYKETQVIPALGHSLDNGVVTPPTATEQGYTTYTCQREGCGYSYKDNFIPPVGEIDLTATVESVTARAGQTVDVNISIDEPVAVKSMSILNVDFDETKLELTGAKWLLSDTIIDDWDQSKMIGASAFKTNKEISGKIFSLTFRILEDVEDCEIEIACELVAKTKPDSIEKNLNTMVVPGKVTVRNILTGDFNADEYVDSDDAIYLLYASLLPDSYTLNQSGDINHDGYVDSDDAIYLLYHTLLPESYPLS